MCYRQIAWLEYKKAAGPGAAAYIETVMNYAALRSRRLVSLLIRKVLLAPIFFALGLLCITLFLIDAATYDQVLVFIEIHGLRFHLLRDRIQEKIILPSPCHVS